MKIRIAVSAEREQAVTEALLRAGFELDDEAELVVLENDRFASHLPVRDEVGNRLHLAVEDIVSIESFGHAVVVHGVDGSYQTADRLYQLCLLLPQAVFTHQQFRHHSAPPRQKDHPVDVHEIRSGPGRRIQGRRDPLLLHQF